MYKIIQHRKIFYILSGVLLIPGIVCVIIFGLHFGIDFTGGTLVEYDRTTTFSLSDVQKFLTDNKYEGATAQLLGNSKVQLKLKTLDQAGHEKITADFTKTFSDAKEVSYASIFPSISSELRKKSIMATVFVFIMIVLYISWSFRKAAAGPVTPWVFGMSAFIALLHDLLMVIGIFALLGKIWKIEIDSMFVTALLTVLGFSVHDTIVVFDRIRERVRTIGTRTGFEDTVNVSVNQTLVRSLATSFTAILTLFALLLFGGQSIRYFVLALIIGIISGTYSSIFVASPLLVTWYNFKTKVKSI